jgi:hypothetical protein
MPTHPFWTAYHSFPCHVAASTSCKLPQQLIRFAPREFQALVDKLHEPLTANCDNAECMPQKVAKANSVGFCPCARGAYSVGAVARGSLSIMQFVRIAYIIGGSEH